MSHLSVAFHPVIEVQNIPYKLTSLQHSYSFNNVCRRDEIRSISKFEKIGIKTITTHGIIEF